VVTVQKAYQPSNLGSNHGRDKKCLSSSKHPHKLWGLHITYSMGNENYFPIVKAAKVRS
jgi:hypothetical protein